MERSLAIAYSVLTPAVGAYCYGLYAVSTGGAGVPAEQRALLAPVVALVALTGSVLVLMALVRNASVARGVASITYYKSYRAHDAPSDWIERPARTYNNLLELPVLFYALCCLMLVTKLYDAAQVQLAWWFVATRALHALIYIGINYVPARFGAYLASSVTLFVMWYRFATQAL